MSITQSDVRRLSKSLVAGPQAGRDSDPGFYQALAILPNPDTILRKAGKSEAVFDAIQADAHVIGELRSVRAGLLRYEHRVVPGAEDAKAMRAAELCEQWMARRPAPGMTWPDVIWNMGTAVFRGFRVHEVIWERNGNLILPKAIVDRPNRRFAFDHENNLRIRTREHPAHGVPAEDYRFLVTRHMPSHENPYGTALLSSCFWPYTFKHGGFKWFVKLCERFGLPFPIGKYPAGTPEHEQNSLSEALEELVEAGYAVFQEGGHIDLLEAKGGGQASSPVQQLLIHECNREMSKALTSQSLATEQNSTGARAASETARERETSVHESDREVIAFTFDEAFRWITTINLGEDVAAPTFEFYEEQEARKDRAEVYEIAIRNSDRVSRSAMHKELNIPMAESDDDAIPQGGNRQQPAAFNKRSPCPDCGQYHYAEADEALLDSVDKAIESDYLAPVAKMLADFERQGKGLREFQQALGELYPRMDDTTLANLTAEALAFEWLKGGENAGGD